MIKMLEYILSRSHRPFWLKILELVLNRLIPFNKSHKFKFTLLTETEAQVSLPFIHSNKNHLGGAHACAIATLGEYPAGLLLLKNFSSKEYRIILKQINVSYLKQGKEALSGTVNLAPAQLSAIKEKALTTAQVEVYLTTAIKSSSDLEIATVLTTWQLKRWSHIEFR